MTAKQQLLVIGIGNTLMTDDGIGIELARALRATGPEFAVVEAGTPGFGLIEFLETARARSVWFVDAIDGRREPGDVFMVAPEDLVNAWHRQSLHQAGLGEALALHQSVGGQGTPGIIGVQPGFVGPGNGLSAGIKARWPEIVNKTRALLKKGVPKI